MPVMEMRNPNWFQHEVTDHIFHTEKDWGQFLHPYLSNNMLHIMTFLTPEMEMRNPKWFQIVVTDHIKHLKKIGANSFIHL